MINEFPNPGQVFEYHYLWKWQSERGETEGRKKRPCCMVLVVVNNSGQRVLFIAAITSKKPAVDRAAIAIPETEAHRASLDIDIPLWIILDELNVDILENSYALEDRTPRGQFSATFTNNVIRSVQQVRKTGGLKISSRT